MVDSVLESCVFGFEFLDLLVFGVFFIEGWGWVDFLGVEGKGFKLLEEGLSEMVEFGKEVFLELLGVLLLCRGDLNKE